MTVRLRACGDGAVSVELDGDLETASVAAVSLLAALEARPPRGMVAVTPGLRSVLVEYDALRTEPASLRGALRRRLRDTGAAVVGRPRVWRIPVRYDGDDIDAVASACGMTVAQVIDAHTSAEHRVAMLGNLPGLPYLLGLPQALAVPRRSRPRERVPRGAVAIARAMTCVYPAAAPGGWNLVGRTPVVLFDVTASPPALLAPGDVVHFEAVPAAEVARLEAAGWRPEPQR